MSDANPVGEDATPAVRIPAAIAVSVVLRTADGKPLDNEVVRGHTRDVSRSGLGIELRSLPKALASALEGEPDGLVAVVDFSLGGRTIRVSGDCTWIRMIADSHGPMCLVGMSFAKVNPETTASLVKHAEKLYHRPRVLRAAALVVVPLLLIGAALFVRARSGHEEQLVEIERELDHAIAQKQVSALQLERAESEIDELRGSSSSQGEVIRSKEEELGQLRREYGALRDRVGELSVSRANLESPDDTRERPAMYYLERGHSFSAKNNLAAALLEYEKAVVRDPKMAAAHLEIALLRDLYGQPAAAIRSYERYLEFEPMAPDAYEIRENIRELREALRKAAGAKEGP